MKTKFYWVVLLASAVLIGQAQGGGDHGGGGGFSGGGHVNGGGGRAGPVGGGNGFRGGGFRAAAPAFGGERRSLGVGSRGGGVGFVMPHYRRPVYLNGRVARSVAPSISERTAASRPQNRFRSTRNTVGQRPAAASNRAANASVASSPGTAAHRGLNGRTDHLAERHDSNWHRDWDRRHAHFFHNRFFVFDNGFWCGLDDGVFPWDYLPYYAGDYYPYDYYTDSQPDDGTAPASAYSYGYYTGVQPDYDTAAVNSAPAPDPTVEAIQERLAQLGYYNSPVDGIFGPTTRDAVANYQTDNQLDVTGSLSPDILESLGVQPVANSDR
jgi:Putative peptidoglycan binding domain